ncbi:MAG: ATP-binding cassette domain-containing protein [Lachnospiraceae bacterium]|jgi:ABC-type multidrug transport system, ATPase component|nr:ATP-binding cassette domain-containing protein [Lachnospiraceae bacterium]MCI8825014.1 ATP-binding cassette domain-containing protein [Lachnospiraceae bacterium]MCI9369679.1 ATP-binding cassette domain-containing protein [Lachnospiraceae bacterium]
MLNLIVNNVSKQLKGKTILSNIYLNLKSGNIYGFVGENGSGKTMLFRAISGLMDISEGEILLNEKVLHKDMKVLPNLGIMIENAGLYPELTGLDNLKLLAKLNRKIGEAEIREAIKKVGLDADDKRTFRKYSLGMKQRIVFAQAIMEKPDILLLDEPTNALDEKGVNSIRQIIYEEKQRGALILIASHNKEDIQILSDEIYHVENGTVKKWEAVI